MIEMVSSRIPLTDSIQRTLSAMDTFVDLAADEGMQTIILSDAGVVSNLMDFLEATVQNYDVLFEAPSSQLSASNRPIVAMALANLYHLYCCLDDVPGKFIMAIMDRLQASQTI